VLPVLDSQPLHPGDLAGQPGLEFVQVVAVAERSHPPRRVVDVHFERLIGGGNGGDDLAEHRHNRAHLRLLESLGIGGEPNRLFTRGEQAGRFDRIEGGLVRSRFPAIIQASGGPFQRKDSLLPLGGLRSRFERQDQQHQGAFGQRPEPGPHRWQYRWRTGPMQVEVNHIPLIGLTAVSFELIRQLVAHRDGNSAEDVHNGLDLSQFCAGANCEKKSGKPVETSRSAPNRALLWQLHQPGHRLNCDLAFDGPGHGWMVSITLDAHHVGGYRTASRQQAEEWAEEVRRTYLADGWSVRGHAGAH